MAIMAIVFGTISCGNVDMHPTQVTKTGEKVVLSSFDEINMSCPFEVNYEPGGSPSVLLDAPEDVFKYITIYVKDNVLHIATNNSVTNGGMNLDFSKVKVNVTSPQLKEVELSGSGNFNARTVNTPEDFEIQVAGSGNVDMVKLACDDVDIQVAGSGKVAISTIICKEIEANMAGSGSIICMNVKANEVKTNVAGSGKVRFKGSAAKHKENVTGSGTVDVSELK